MWLVRRQTCSGYVRVVPPVAQERELSVLEWRRGKVTFPSADRRETETVPAGFRRLVDSVVASYATAGVDMWAVPKFRQAVQ